MSATAIIWRMASFAVAAGFIGLFAVIVIIAVTMAIDGSYSMDV